MAEGVRGGGAVSGLIQTGGETTRGSFALQKAAALDHFFNQIEDLHMPAKKAAPRTGTAPCHLNPIAKKVYSETVQAMKELGTYHITDNLLIEQLAVLVSQSRVLQRAVDTGQSVNITKDLTLINTFSGQISRLTNRLGIAQDSRPSDRPLGRPTKQSGLTVDDDDAAAWSNVLPIGGE